MPISKIQVNEYKCRSCGHQWINRVNGEEGPIPKRCASCKTSRWHTNKATPKERGLRRRIKGSKALYEFEDIQWFLSGWKRTGISLAESWSDSLVDEFLNLNPPPTLAELKQVLYPPELVLRPLTSENHYYVKRGYMPDPVKPGWLKHDPEEYMKNRKLEVQKRQQMMRDMIKKRRENRTI